MSPKLLKNIISELNESLSGGIISKIHQSDQRNLILRIFARGREERLIISAHHKYPRIHLTEAVFYNPPTPLRFCAYLRSRITNARIEEFRQKDDERVLEVALARKHDEIIEKFTLIAELTGKSSNIILVDEKGVVLDAIRYFPPDGSLRVVMPGVILEPLPPHKEAFRQEEFSKEPYTTWNEATDAYYSAFIKEEEFISERNRLRRVALDAEKKLKKKLLNLNGDKDRAEREREFSKLGDTLIYNLNKMKRGMKEVELDDYTVYPPGQVKVALDEKLSPKENAEKYFKRSKKAKTALNLLKDRIPQVETDIEYMGQVLYEIEAARTREDLRLMEDELAKGGYVKKMPEEAGHIKEEEKKAEPIRRYTSSEGFEILCGKSGAGNDMIVQRHAANEDIWFHIAHMPGSHVLIKVAGRGKELTKKTIEEAAALAAWHSKAQNAGKVEVIYAEAKHVRKPKGAKPGMVTVKEHKSILVRPKGME